VSPFAVSASAARSYKAQQTMSGSRLKAEMKRCRCVHLGSDQATVVGYRRDKRYRLTGRHASARPQQSHRRAKPQRDRLLLPAPARRRRCVVKIQFTMPEALTEMEITRLRSRRAASRRFPHRQGRHGQGPHGRAQPARFVREGDALEFTVKVSNQSRPTADRQSKLTFSPTPRRRSRSTTRSATAPTEQAFDPRYLRLRNIPQILVRG